MTALSPLQAPGEVLIKVCKTSICGTDVHIYDWAPWAQQTIPVPLVVGHEFMGEIDQLGAGVSGLQVGTRISGEGHLTCGACRNCRAGRRHFCRHTVGVGVQRAGCFAEYLSLPADNVYPLPDSVPDDIGCLFDPLGNAAHTALSFDLVGEDVLITGAGPIGIMAASICRHAGARHVVITDVNDHRLTLARKFDVTCAVNVARDNIADVAGTLGMTEGFDVGLEMSGNPRRAYHADRTG